LSLARGGHLSVLTTIHNTLETKKGDEEEEGGYISKLHLLKGPLTFVFHQHQKLPEEGT
jgi:hypothetical protein